MKSAIIVRERVCQDIELRTDKVLRELGYPEPPLSLDDVRALLDLDRGYFSSSEDGLLQSTISRLKRGGRQILRRPTLLIDAIAKFDLRALYLPDRKHILIDDSLPEPKHRWLEAHEIGHDLLPWHHEMLMGDDEVTPTASTHDKMEAQANYAAGSLLFLGNRFREDCKQLQPSIANAKLLAKRYGNSFTTTLWRMVEYCGEKKPILAAIGRLPFLSSGPDAFRHLIPSAAFNNLFEIPSAEGLLCGIRTYCHRGNRGPLGDGELVITDRNGNRHLFDFETFSNTYDTLTLGVHRCSVATTVAVLQPNA